MDQNQYAKRTCDQAINVFRPRMRRIIYHVDILFAQIVFIIRWQACSVHWWHPHAETVWPVGAAHPALCGSYDTAGKNH